MRRWIKGAYDWVGRTLSLTGDAEPWRQLFGGSTYAGKSVDEVTAMQASAVFGCVRGIAETAATLPIKVYERDRNGNANEVDHPLAEVLAIAPNADMVDVDFRESKFANLALQGNGYALKETRGDGNVSSLYPIVANCVQPRRNRDSGDIEYRVNDRGRWETYPRDKMWHTRGFGSNGLVGLSPIQCMRQAIGLSLATEEFGARFFSQGASTSGIVTFPTFLTSEQRAQAKQVLANKYEGLGQSHRLMVLEGGMTYTPVSMNLDDAEYLLLRGFQVDEICRIYRYPPHMVAKMDRSTFANIEQQAIEFAVYTLAPYLVRFERSASRWLLKPEDRKRFFVRFNLEGLLRGDAAARATFYNSMLQNGVYNRNEVRALENRNRVEGSGMEDYTVQSNMISVDDLAAFMAGKSGSAKAVDDTPVPSAHDAIRMKDAMSAFASTALH